jgi:hypothetical protein
LLGGHHDGGCASHADGQARQHCSVVHAHACCALPASPTALSIRTACATQLPETPAVASRRVPPLLRPPAPRVA